ncbi:MAG: UDP-3-O-(3-hydroxymyristoyl)glucosamine N-acyltransferase [Alphaproteobacteria bacterium]
MPDPRFFRRAGPFSLKELAERSGATVAVDGSGDRQFYDVAPLSQAGEGDVSFLDNRKYLEEFLTSRAGAIVVNPDLASRAPTSACLLLSDQPYMAYAHIAKCFYPNTDSSPGIAETALIDKSAKVGENCMIGAGVVIGPKAQIGTKVSIGPNVTIDTAVEIGSGTTIGANASLSHCIIGENCQIHPGVRIGTRGFGFATTATGHIDVPQLGRVIIGNHVEIGANSTVDRGAGPDTVIGDGCRIDNLVQIGHNVHLGRHCVIVSQVGIAGSTVLEDFVVVAAQAGIAGHLTIGAGTMIGAQSGVMADLEPKTKVIGSPAVPVKQFFRQVAALAKMVRKE